MKKIRLDVENLRVESFQTQADEAEEGTVFGREATKLSYCTCVIPCDTSYPIECIPCSENC